MTDDVEPNWEIRHGWHIVVDGLPTIKAHVAGGRRRRDEFRRSWMSLAMIMTALPTVNAIPHVVLVFRVATYKDLPLVTSARRVRTGDRVAA